MNLNMMKDPELARACAQFIRNTEQALTVISTEMNKEGRARYASTDVKEYLHMITAAVLPELIRRANENESAR